MNDPGHEESIANADSAVQHTYAEQTDNRVASGPHEENAPHSPDEKDTTQFHSPAYSQPVTEKNDTAHEMPTRWWYASTGFPLLAGTFGPMANAFSICALVENWRVEVPPGGTEEHGIDIPDPKWLIAVNAVSLAFALIANLSLLLNMAKRMPFRWAQPITIFGFWISGVLLVILIGIAAHDFHAPGVQVQALSQAYYYACWAAGLYQLISIMMCVTVYGALTKRYSESFNLTMAQRTLMLQTIAFLTYLLIGALIYSHIEGWKYLNAVYWADFTLLTVGLGGDVVPSTHLGRGLLFPFSIGGIVTLGLVVSSIRTMVLDRGKVKLHARMTEKMRRKVVKEVEKVQDSGKSKHRRMPGTKSNLAKQLTLDPMDDPDGELNRRRVEFETMRKIEELTSRRQKWMNLIFSTTAFAILWFLGALVFWQTEGRNQGWSYFIALYFSWTSLLTIGYGDFIPLSNAGRPFFVFWSLLAVPSLTILISDMGDTVVKAVKDVTIWIGEVSILPSNQGTVLERLHYGLGKTLRIQISSLKAQDPEGNADSDSDSGGPFQQPGMVRLFKSSRRGSNKSHNQDVENSDRLAKDFEESENLEERRAHQRGDSLAEDEHHYRRQLISEIRKLYADANSAVPKKYTYDEWAYYLKLLGEDEASGSLHRHAPVKSHHTHPDKHQSQDSDEQEGVSQWSWIGPRSPLMTRGTKTEPEWIIARLFQKLEESLASSQKQGDGTAGKRPGASTNTNDNINPRLRHTASDDTAKTSE